MSTAATLLVIAGSAVALAALVLLGLHFLVRRVIRGFPVFILAEDAEVDPEPRPAHWPTPHLSPGGRGRRGAPGEGDASRYPHRHRQSLS